jgi:hypothetical protein
MSKVQLQPGKTEYTQTEAANALGLSPDQFRLLLRRHLVKDDELGNVEAMRFRPTDILLLGVLGGSGSID